MSAEPPNASTTFSPPFRISLTTPTALAAAPEPIEVPGDEDPEEGQFNLLHEACARLQAADCRFEVSGFGDQAWEVDLWYDLSTIVTHLRPVLDDLSKARNTDLDFFGQGVERFIDIEVRGSTATLTCTSYTDWQPNPEQVVMALIDLLSMLRKFAADFACAAIRLSPNLAGAEPFASWAQLGREAGAR